MKIRYISDLHLEFAPFTLPVQKEEKDQILVLAGDIGVVKSNSFVETYLPFLSQMNGRFRAVILVIGNHEHYRGSFQLTLTALRDAIASMHNVYLLDKQTHVIDEVAFIGATLWTDCDNRNPHANHFWNYMNDGRMIRNGPSESDAFKAALSAADTANDHKKAKEYILKAVRDQRIFGRKAVVVTHHGVSAQSIHPKYAGSPLNMFFSSNMTDSWIATKPDLIIHGHTHESLDYVVSGCDTRVVCNPRGYVTMNNPHGENLHFDPMKVVEL